MDQWTILAKDESLLLKVQHRFLNLLKRSLEKFKCVEFIVLFVSVILFDSYLTLDNAFKNTLKFSIYRRSLW